MFTFILSAAALLQAAPVVPPESPIGLASKAFGQCVRSKVPVVPATMSAEAGADWILAQCSAERAALEQRLEEGIASAPEAEKTAARENLRSGIAKGRDGLVKGITAMRQGKGR